jgi:hypothetical protein
MSNNQSTIEKALAMYTETVSPSKDTLVYVLNQIPEIKELKASDRRAIRSPYRWLAFAQVLSVLVVALAVYPNMTRSPQAENPFYEVDVQIEQFERGLDAEDYDMMMVSDYTL